jgi:folate-binding protein YgfZ
LKRLSMFVLRAKCSWRTRRPTCRCTGSPAKRRSAPSRACPCGAARARRPPRDRLPDGAGLTRALVAGPLGDGIDAITLDTWGWLEVQSGVPVIEPRRRALRAQMLNFELVGGVNFQKGCYPGQEIVARAQYRGTVKRRTFLFDVDAPAHAGRRCIDATIRAAGRARRQRRAASRRRGCQRAGRGEARARRGRRCIWARPTARGCAPRDAVPVPVDADQPPEAIANARAAGNKFTSGGRHARAVHLLSNAADARMRRARGRRSDAGSLRQRHPGLTARLLRRPDEHDQQQTWMEIYAMHRRRPAA